MTPELHSASWSALGTSAVVLTTEAGDLAEASAVVQDELAAIDLACSRFREDSEIATVNGSPGRWVEVSPLFMQALDTALGAAQATSGDVDPTVGRALRVAGYDRDFAELPALRTGRISFVPAPGWGLVQVDHERRAARVPRGVELDFGATAKALAADRAARACADVVGGGVLVNLGGDLAVAGPAPEGGWPVRVTEDHMGGFHAPGQTVSITSGGIATSSIAVRRWRNDGEELHHIIDPATGRPAATFWRMVSVAAVSCVAANIASTAAMVRGAGALGWLDSLRLPARLVAPDGMVARVGPWPAEAPG
jgi:thiamine biosynthesis lipoprotein